MPSHSSGSSTPKPLKASTYNYTKNKQFFARPLLSPCTFEPLIPSLGGPLRKLDPTPAKDNTRPISPVTTPPRFSTTRSDLAPSFASPGSIGSLEDILEGEILDGDPFEEEFQDSGVFNDSSPQTVFNASTSSNNSNTTNSPHNIKWQYSCNHKCIQGSPDQVFTPSSPSTSSSASSTKERATPGLCPECLKHQYNYQQTTSVYREQIALFKRQIKDAENSGNTDLAKSINELMGRSYEMWGDVILQTSKSPSSNEIPASTALSQKLEESLEKATVLQKCEDVVMDEILGAGYEECSIGKRVKERCAEWRNVVKALGECQSFYRDHVETDLVLLEEELGETCEKARMLMGEDVGGDNDGD